ncbi:MAG TPA: M23 family metallopeptidase [Clostridiales bacterium]|nr:M23 family metallopeptidase [Clostridiales bacterium]
MRKFSYGAVGILTGIIVYIMLLVNIPTEVNVKSILIEFTKKNNNSEYISNDSDFNGGSIVPFLEYGSYHVSAGTLSEYEKKEIVQYGKANPTFYFKNKSISETDENIDDYDEDYDGYEDDYDEDYDDYDEDIDIGEISMLEGFNIHTRQREVVDIVNIKDSFSKYGKFPIDRNLYNVTSRFGERLDPFENLRSFHVGLDISADDIDGANIYATVHGIVVESAVGDTGYGNYIVVKHDGFETLYAHMRSKPLFEVGNQVHAGDILGYIGSTGRSTGPHLHFEVGVGGVQLNPEVFLKEIKGSD